MRKNTSTTTASANFLRVKRQRDLPPLSSSFKLRMTLSRTPTKQYDDEDRVNKQFSQLMTMNPSLVAHQEEQQHQQEVTTKSLLVTRMGEYVNCGVVSDNNSSCSINNDKKVRVLECLYDNDVVPGEEEEESPSKRRKIQLHLVQSKEVSYKDLFSCLPFGNKEKSPGIPPTQTGNHKNNTALSSHVILDPLTRIIDEQLKLFFEQGIANGCTTNKNSSSSYLLQLYQNDYLKSTITSPMQRLNKILFHSSASSAFKGGTILHAISLWNNVSQFHDLLQQLNNILMSSTNEATKHDDNNSSIHILSALLATINEDGVTPIQLAQILGNESIVSEYEKFKGDQQQYVYDMFRIEEVETFNATTATIQTDDNKTYSYYETLNNAIRDNEINDTNILSIDNGKNENHNDSSTTSDDNEDAISVEIKGGLLGYWNEHGELILMHDNEDNNGVATNYEGEYDHDSNDEFYEGNDYPEEEEESQSNYSDESSNSTIDGINNHATTRRQQQYFFSGRDPKNNILFEYASSNSSSSFGEESSSSCADVYEDRFSRRYFGSHVDRNSLLTVETSMLLTDKSTTFAYDSEYEDHV